MFLFHRSSRSVAADEFEKFLYIISFACAFTIGICYNLDTKNVKLFIEPKTFDNSRDSYFGFSTALYVGVDRHSKDSIILVGAPRANDSAIPSVNEPGIVYKCKINEEECEKWNFDPTGNTPFTIGDIKFNQFKNNSWIGATLGVENNGISEPSAVVCAPRWTNRGSSTKNWYMNGMCYYTSIAANGEKFEKLATKRLTPLGSISRRQYRSYLHLHDYAYCETGVSLHLHSDKNQSAIMLGNPGVLEWRGIPLLLKEFDAIIPEANVGYTPRMPIRGNDYFGYSVSSGFYFGGGERWYAAGAPRGGYDKTGGVLIFPFSFAADGIFDKSYLLDGEQLGEYFGASLTSCDVNNDGRDDIIVGAPFWSKDMDEGRVYIYTTNSKNKFVELFRLDGKSPGGRFGSVVTCLGDLDKDGFKDIAIGAPYENDHGAIYIYNGNRKGLNENYRQRIAGESIYKNVRGFGGAISEPQDVDGNDYVDIAVGAYLSSQVFLLRSQPVITIQLNVDTDVKQLQPNSTGFELKICSTYSGISVPDQIVFVITLKMDPLKAYRDHPETKKRTNGIYYASFLYSNELINCPQYRINLVEDRKNMMESIEIAVSVKPIIHSSGGFCPECPVINKSASKMNQSITVPFATDCGNDNECNSFLEISSLSSNDLENGTHYTLGSKPIVRLVVGFSNNEEPAYDAQAHIFIPTSISLVRASHDFQEKISNIDNILEVICDLGNPLKGNTNVILELKMNDVQSDIESIVIFANISTTSQNDRAKIVSRNLTIHFVVDADMAIDGKSQQDIDSYLDIHKELLESIRFQHIYEVRKLGVSPIEESVVTVLVPTHWRDNDKSSIEIATVNETLGVMQGKTFECSISNRIDDKKIVNEAGISSESLILENAHEDQHNLADRSTAAEDFNLKLPPDNRALIINCTNPAFKCSEISCKLGKFENSLTFAKLTITLDLQLRNLKLETIEGKDIIFFVSNGSVIKTKRGLIDKNVVNKHIGTLVGTTFVGAPIAKGVAIWVIVVSVLLGIILLVLLSLALVKLGFFQRTKREELEALKAESAKTQGFVLETSSSQEVLDAD